MTPDELRSLVDEATPGPWRARDDKTIAANDERDTLGSNSFITGAVIFKPPDARLIALAPDLARLCAELGEALIRVRWLTKFGPGVPMARPSEATAIDAALAKLSALES